MKGIVIHGSRNVFTVKKIDAGAQNGAASINAASSAGEASFFECRIKGKVLKGGVRRYNPLAPADVVVFEPDEDHAGTALITGLETRRNLFTRFNLKGRLSQILAANVDRILCITTLASPPFRPRFLDRVLLQAAAAGIDAVIVCNKTDLDGGSAEERERLSDYERIGYKILRLSAATGENMAALRALVADRVSVLIGQSGVGKSSIINALVPRAAQKTGSINEKWDRGNHTTVMSRLLQDGNTSIIDTPGIRHFIPDGIAAAEAVNYMPETAPLAGRCAFGASCSHRQEAGCKIREAAEKGLIHAERRESLLRIENEIIKLEEKDERKTKRG